MKSKALAACLAAMLTGVVHAHPTLEQAQGFAGSGYKAVFRIPHGCDGAPTRAVEVDIPLGARGARPMPKPGWRLEVTRAPLASPHIRHGRAVTDDTVRVRWSARTDEDMLPHEQYDEFVLVVTLPDTPGVLYWPLRQVCAQGRADWIEVPRATQDASSLKMPAPVLRVAPADRHGATH